MIFSDAIHKRVTSVDSPLVAGFDPVFEGLPSFATRLGEKSPDSETSIYTALTAFYGVALAALDKEVAAIKPNIAFFEQFGIGGLRAFRWVTEMAKDAKIPVIADIKRGDIGSTAEAYANAYLGTSEAFGKEFEAFPVDSITVNPFLGFDTLEPFLNRAVKGGKGLFILVRTSNPGSKDLQLATFERVAEWISSNSDKLIGTSGLSGLGAVVGATNPENLKKLRKVMPKSLFLIPGVGAQGGTVKDIASGFTTGKQGALINLSRSLMSSHQRDISKEEFIKHLKKIAQSFRQEVKEITS